MCLVVTAITAAEFQCRCAKRSNVEALDAKCVMTNSLSPSTKHHQFVSRFSEFGLRDFVARPKPMLGWS
jgi:hypothetical protein